MKVSVATTLAHWKGGQFIPGSSPGTHTKALPGKPYDGDTLGSILPEVERTVGTALQRIIADAGYKGRMQRLGIASRFTPQNAIEGSSKT